MLIYLRVLKESLNFAINSLANNKLRTFLSLLGVTVGIFTIVGILAAVNSLKLSIEGIMSGLDKNTIYVKRYSYAPTDVPRWQREQFPDVSYEEYQRLGRTLADAEAVSYAVNVPPEAVRFEDQTVDNVPIVAITHEYYYIEALRLAGGRFYNETESNSGAPVVVLGDEVARSLFGEGEAVGQSVRMYGRRFRVIGVLEKEGAGLFGGDTKDTSAFVPANAVRKMYGSDLRAMFPVVIIKPRRGTDQASFVATIKQNLRSVRGLKAGEIDNFFIDELRGFTELIDNIIGQMNFYGFIISAFSLLVGGFGIANIMFVSVTERTPLIGIQKSIGARSRFVLSQFLFEAVILAVIGGLAGIVLVWGASLLASQFTGDFKFVLSTVNIVWGVGISAIIGILSGILPAIKAARLDPVEAIRTGM